VVSYDYDSRRKCDIPDAVASAIRALEGWKGDGSTAE
jgi:hypothetical protein